MIVVMLGLMILGLLMIYSTSSYNSAATDMEVCVLYGEEKGA